MQIILELLKKASADFERQEDALELLENIHLIEKKLFLSLKETNGKGYLEAKPLINIIPTTTTIKPKIAIPITSTNNTKAPETKTVKEQLLPKSLNESITDENVEIDRNIQLKNSQIKDLSKAIDLNTKYLFIEALFHHDDKHYQETINAINEAQNFETAMLLVNQNIIDKFQIANDNEFLIMLIQFVKRRFSI